MSSELSISQVNTKQLKVRQLGLADYQSVWQAMQDFTKTRDEDTPDEIWVVEHPPILP